MLRGTTTHTFSTAELSKSALTLVCHHHFYVQTRAVSKCSEVLRSRGVFNVLTSKWACNFLISHLPRWLRTRRFNEPTFQPFGATRHGINTVFGYFFYPFAHFDLLSSDCLQARARRAKTAIFADSNGNIPWNDRIWSLSAAH